MKLFEIIDEIEKDKKIQMRRQQYQKDRYVKYKNDHVPDLLKFNAGKIFIEFMLEEGKIKLIAKFEDVGWMLKKTVDKKYFNSVNAFTKYLQDNIDSQYESDLKKVKEYVFDKNDFNLLSKQIKQFALERPLKAKSLTYRSDDAVEGESKSSWDMVIMFKQSVENFKNNKITRIVPSLVSGKEFGKIIGPEEQEVKWDKEKLNKYISNH